MLDTAARQLARGETQLHLSRKALDLLVLLIEQRHRVVTRQEISDALWPKTFVVDANVANLIVEIRRVTGDESHEIIRTVHGTGYRFEARVEERAKLPGRSPAAVHVVEHEGGQTLLHEGENLVGREPAADVFLSSGSVSRRHALITVSGSEATIVDLDSKHGTFSDGVRIRDAVALRDDCVLRFGKVEVRYRKLTGLEQTDSFLDSEL